MYCQRKTNDGDQNLRTKSSGEALSTYEARGPLTLACRQSKTCRNRPFVSVSVVTRLSRHNVVAPTPAAPLLTDTFRSTVGSGTHEDTVTELGMKGDASHQRIRHVRRDPSWFVRMLRRLTGFVVESHTTYVLFCSLRGVPFM